MIRRVFIAAALTLLALCQGAAAQTIVANIPLADGSMKLSRATPAGAPRATLVMFPGSAGIVQFGASGAIGPEASNFLVRTQSLWLAQGFAVVVLGAPNDRTLNGHRHEPAYADTVARAVDFARTRVNAPVWLIGTSQGSIGAAFGAAHLPGRVAGVVLTSSVAGHSDSGETVFDTDLGAITVPALVVANLGDACSASAPGYAPQILAALTRSPRKELITVDSRATQSGPCEAMSPHGYLGIEADVVQRVSAWIGATPTR